VAATKFGKGHGRDTFGMDWTRRITEGILTACRQRLLRHFVSIAEESLCNGGKLADSDITCWSVRWGVVTWLLVLCVGSLAVKPGVDFEEPFMMLIGPPIYGILANICYSLGWVVDATFYRGQPRTALYRTGLIFSLVLTALPGVWAIVAWCITLYTGKKLD
jgi:hypothetical protein